MCLVAAFVSSRMLLPFALRALLLFCLASRLPLSLRPLVTIPLRGVASRRCLLSPPRTGENAELTFTGHGSEETGELRSLLSPREGRRKSASTRGVGIVEKSICNSTIRRVKEISFLHGMFYTEEVLFERSAKLCPASGREVLG